MRLRYHLGFVVALAALALLPALQADEPDKPKADDKPVDVGSLPETQDLIFFTEKRPILVRLRLYIDGKPASEHWDEYQKKLFEYFDVDGDGEIDKVEAARLIDAMTLGQFFSGNAFLNNQPPRPPAFEDIHPGKTGGIKPEELAAYYRRNGAGPYVAVTGVGRKDTANQLTDALFAALDSNRDGKLSKEELIAADKILMKFDDNDDEMVTAQELLAVAFNPYARQPAPPQPGRPAITNLLLIPKEEGENPVLKRLNLAKDVIAKYGKNKPGKVNRDEIGFPKDLFDVLDKDKRGELNEYGLLPWVVAGQLCPPDAECTVRLGRPVERLPLIEPAKDSKSRSGLKLTPTSTTSLAMSFQSSEVSVARGEIGRYNSRGADQQFQNIRQTFKMIDKDNRGYVTLEQIDKNPQFQFLKSIFTLADRDGNGKLTENELQAYLEIAGAAQGAQIALTFSDNGQGLFEMIDANGDGRLSIREMRSAWNRLSMHAVDGAVSRNNIPRQYQLLVGGTPNNNNRGMMVDPATGQMGGPRSDRGTTQRGPLWFRKMDVNGDGDVSEREFLGSKEDFRRINTSGDGLISVEEAEKADAWFREKYPQK